MAAKFFPFAHQETTASRRFQNFVRNLAVLSGCSMLLPFHFCILSLTSTMFFSDHAHGQAQGIRQEHQGDAEQTPVGADAQGGPAGRRPDQGLQPKPVAQVQEARLQELPEHLPAVVDAAPQQHTSHGERGRHQGGIHQERVHGQGFQVFPVSEVIN